MAGRSQALQLYKTMMREASKFPDFNFRYVRLHNAHLSTTTQFYIPFQKLRFETSKRWFQGFQKSDRCLGDQRAIQESAYKSGTHQETGTCSWWWIICSPNWCFLQTTLSQLFDIKQPLSIEVHNARKMIWRCHRYICSLSSEPVLHAVLNRLF